MPSLVNLGGSLVAPSQARVSVFDRGFLYGDSIYEVVRTYGNRPFELLAHLERLEHSAEKIGMRPRWSAERTVREVDRTLIAARGGDDEPPDAAPWNRGERYIRIVMTRGSGELGLDPALADDPLALIIVQPLHGPPARSYVDGVKALLVEAGPRSFDPSAKTGQHLSNVLAVKAARAAGAHEALFVDAQGLVTEGASSNVFVVKSGQLATPPLAVGILEGITRKVVLAIAREEGLAVSERPLARKELQDADEVFITSTVREMMPVTALGVEAVGRGRPGEVTHALHRAFRKRAGGPASVEAKG